VQTRPCKCLPHQNILVVYIFDVLPYDLCGLNSSLVFSQLGLEGVCIREKNCFDITNAAQFEDLRTLYVHKAVY
jgi:hypothetical protein